MEVITGRAGPQADPPVRQSVQVGKLTGAAARARIVPVLAGQLAQLALVNVRDDVGRQEALAHVPQQTDRAGTVTLDAQLGS